MKMELVMMVLAGALLALPVIRSLASARGHGWGTACNVQAQAALMARFLGGAKLYFAADGSTAGVVTVASGTQPDVSTDYEDVPFLGCVEKVVPRVEEEEQVYHCPRSTGGYEKRTERYVVGDFIRVTFNSANEYIWRLLFGKAAAVATGTAFQPFVEADRKILGWLFCDTITQAEAGTLWKAEYWVEARLVAPPEHSPDAAQPEIEFQILENALNSVLFPS